MIRKYAVSLTADQWAAIEGALLEAAWEFKHKADTLNARHCPHRAILAIADETRFEELHAMLRAAVDAAKPVEVA